MTHAEIESFLAVCRCRSMTKAAEALFIGQSSLSIRIKTLERELGGQLFHRRRGGRELTLTAAGEAFYELAAEYAAIMEKMKKVCVAQPKTLRVSAFNSLSAYVLPEACHSFLRQYPEVELSVQDMELDAASRSIYEGHTDIAFTAGKTADGNLRQHSAFSEPMVLLSGKELPQPLQAESLPLRDEVYVEWSSSFARWHRKTFGDTQPRISIAVMEQLRSFLEEGDAWAIVPVSVAAQFEQTLPLRRYPTAFPLPTREISYVTAADPADPETIGRFLECLRQSLAHRGIVACGDDAHKM